jgi:hypothetical protein
LGQNAICARSEYPTSVMTSQADLSPTRKIPANDMRIGAQFGLTPNGRLRLSGIKPPPPPSKFDGLLG